MLPDFLKSVTSAGRSSGYTTVVLRIALKMRVSMDHLVEYTDREKPTYLKKNIFGADLSTVSPTRSGSGSNQGRYCDRLVTNFLI